MSKNIPKEAEQVFNIAKIIQIIGVALFAIGAVATLALFQYYYLAINSMVVALSGVVLIAIGRGVQTWEEKQIRA